MKPQQAITFCGNLGPARMLGTRAVWFLIPLVGLVELALHGLLRDQAPTAEEWARLSEAIERIRRPGDIVVVAPRWAEPLARRSLGDAVMPLRHLARADLSDHREALELSVLGEHAAELAAFAEVERLEAEPFRIRRLRNPRYEPTLYQFDDNVHPDHLSVVEVFEGVERTCPFTPRAPSSAGGLGGHPAYPRARFVCSGGRSAFVGVTVIDDAEYRPRRCIFAHPVQGGTLRLRFKDVPFGRAIQGYGGLPFLIFRDGVGAPVTLRAHLDGRQSGLSVHRDEAGFSPFRWEFGAPTAAVGEVMFEIESADARAREFCFTAAMK